MFDCLTVKRQQRGHCTAKRQRVADQADKMFSASKERIELSNSQRFRLSFFPREIVEPDIV
jgi:hypothetical protein